jgi:hypothetical protein
MRDFLTPESAREMRKLSPSAIDLLRHWIEEWPEKVRELDKAGTLIGSVKRDADEEALRQWRTRLRAIAGRHRHEQPSH